MATDNELLNAIQALPKPPEDFDFENPDEVIGRLISDYLIPVLMLEEVFKRWQQWIINTTKTLEAVKKATEKVEIDLLNKQADLPTHER